MLFVPGGPIIGVYVDNFFPKKPIWGVYHMTILSVLVFLALSFAAQWGMIYVSLLLILAGATNCGPDALLTGTQI